LAEGRLSFSRVRAPSRVATAQNESERVEIALRSTGSQVERVVRGYRAATEEPRKRLYLAWHTDDDGAVVLRGRFAPEEGAAIVAATEREIAHGAGEDLPAGTPERPRQTFPRERRRRPRKTFPRERLPCRDGRLGSRWSRSPRRPSKNPSATMKATDGWISVRPHRAG
jgi:hypothetical protein